MNTNQLLALLWGSTQDELEATRAGFLHPLRLAMVEVRPRLPLLRALLDLGQQQERLKAFKKLL